MAPCPGWISRVSVTLSAWLKWAQLLMCAEKIHTSTTTYILSPNTQTQSMFKWLCWLCVHVCAITPAVVSVNQFFS